MNRKNVALTQGIRAVAGRLAASAAAIAVLLTAGAEARHVVLAVTAALVLVGAGAGFLLRWRVTGNRHTWLTGIGLVLLGLHHPAGVAVDALLGERWPAAGAAARLALVVAAGAVTLRAFPGGGRHPRRLKAAGHGLAGSGLAAAVVWTAGASELRSLMTDGAQTAGLLLGALLWSLVAVMAWRTDPLGARDRRSCRAMAGMALTVGLVHLLEAVAVWVSPAAGPVEVTGDIALAAVALAAVVIAVRGLTDALAGQERYVAGLLEQLAGHERQLQAARACLHDSRAAVAGIRAASSAVRHLGQGSESARDLEESVAVELGRLERMLRLPDRSPRISAVDLDQVVRVLVVSHRERGLRVSWAPSGSAPVTVDGDALAVILGNLLGNALAHAPRSLCRVELAVADRVTVTVTDDGPGLAPARAAAAFEAGARRADSPGEGLGLAISRDLARRQGGDLVLADGDTGCRFVLTLPVNAPSERCPAPSAPPIPAPRGSMEAVA